MEPSFSYMVLGEYPAQASTKLISKEWIARARSRWDAYVVEHGEIPPATTSAVMGQDVGEFGTDGNVACFRYGGYVEKLVVWSGVDVIQTGDRAVGEYQQRQVERANVDATGVGAGVAPHMQRKDCVAIPVKVASKPTQSTEMGEFRILRDQLWWACREWLRTDPGAMLPPDEMLVEELQTPIYEVKGGKISVMDKDTMRELLKRSPDRADALCLTFYADWIIDGYTCLESIIQVIRPKGIRADEHLAEIEGFKELVKPTKYRLKSTGEDFIHLAASLAFPTTFPGAAVVVAVKFAENQLSWHVLDEAESFDTDGLLANIPVLRSKYGFPKTSELFQTVFGEPQRFLSFLVSFNRKLQVQKTYGIYLAQQDDFDHPYNGLIYWRRVTALLAGDKTLFLRNANLLRSRLQTLLAEDDEKKRDVYQYPPIIMALGQVIHSLVCRFPWLEKLSCERVIPTRFDDYLLFGEHDQEAEMRELWGDDFDRESRDGLRPTIFKE